MEVNLCSELITGRCLRFFRGLVPDLDRSQYPTGISFLEAGISDAAGAGDFSVLQTLRDKNHGRGWAGLSPTVIVIYSKSASRALALSNLPVGVVPRCFP